MMMMADPANPVMMMMTVSAKPGITVVAAITAVIVAVAALLVVHSLAVGRAGAALMIGVALIRLGHGAAAGDERERRGARKNEFHWMSPQSARSAPPAHGRTDDLSRT